MMCERIMIAMAAFLLLRPALSQEQGEKESSAILKKLDSIERRLERMEQDIRQLEGMVRHLDAAGGPRPEEPGSPPETDPKEIWDAMGNPKELNRRLDSLVKSFSPKIPDERKRGEFVEEVEALKETIGKETSEDELYHLVQNRFSERIGNTTNDKERAWLQRELKTLEQSKNDERKQMIDRFVRFHNIRVLFEFAQKNSIPPEEMVRHGLAFIGDRRRPPGEPGRPEGERRGDDRSRGTPGQQRGKPSR